MKADVSGFCLCQLITNSIIFIAYLQLRSKLSPLSIIFVIPDVINSRYQYEQRPTTVCQCDRNACTVVTVGSCWIWRLVFRR